MVPNPLCPQLQQNTLLYPTLLAHGNAFHRAKAACSSLPTVLLRDLPPPLQTPGLARNGFAGWGGDGGQVMVSGGGCKGKLWYLPLTLRPWR